MLETQHNSTNVKICLNLVKVSREHNMERMLNTTVTTPQILHNPSHGFA